MPWNLHFQRLDPLFGRAYFNELSKDPEVTPAKPRGVPLLAWEDLDDKWSVPDNSAHTPTYHPRPFKLPKLHNKKRVRRGDDSLGKIHVADGRATCLL